MPILNIKSKIDLVYKKIEMAAITSGRKFEDITLIAVSKKQSIESILSAQDAGIKTFGENYAQELVSKINVLESIGRHVDFHFIGHLQTNKIKIISNKIQCIQTIDNFNLAYKLDQYIAVNNLDPLEVLIQVNVSSEPQKYGINPDDLMTFMASLIDFSHLRITGLMTIGSITTNFDTKRNEFKLLRSLRDNLNSFGYSLKELSMGMSEDYELAISEGATIVRLGSAIFGNRT